MCHQVPALRASVLDAVLCHWIMKEADSLIDTGLAMLVGSDPMLFRYSNGAYLLQNFVYFFPVCLYFE